MALGLIWSEKSTPIPFSPAPPAVGRREGSVAGEQAQREAIEDVVFARDHRSQGAARARRGRSDHAGDLLPNECSPADNIDPARVHEPERCPALTGPAEEIVTRGGDRAERGVSAVDPAG